MNSRTPEQLPVVAVNFIFQQSQLVLGGCQLAVYLVCSAHASSRSSWCRFELTPAQLVTATGYSLNSVKAAIQNLLARGYILRLGADDFYELSSPRDAMGYGHPLTAGRRLTLRTVLMHTHIPYLQLPTELFTQLPRMSAVELQATVVMLQLTAYSRSTTIKAAAWAKQANIANTRDLLAVMDKMEWCMNIYQQGTSRLFTIYRTDRDTREERADKEMEREIAKNDAPEQERPYTTAVLLEWLEALNVHSQPGCDNSDLRIFCPFCNSLKPSLSINLDKGTHGLFWCHSCRVGRHKVLFHLLDQLNIPKQTYTDKLNEIAARYAAKGIR